MTRLGDWGAGKRQGLIAGAEERVVKWPSVRYTTLRRNNLELWHGCKIRPQENIAVTARGEMTAARPPMAPLIGVFADAAETGPTPVDRSRQGRGRRAPPDRAGPSRSRAARNAPPRHRPIAA